jgi:hypothetical protein
MTTTNHVQRGAHHGGLPTPTPNQDGRLEGVVQVVIMLAVAAMAGAASFRHVHDWTMHNSPPGTGDWFGWANAMVSELIPLAAGLEARRRHRRYGHAGAYPLTLILAAVALSLTGQFAEAKPGLSGWLIAAVPALGFLALVKLVLSGPITPPSTPRVVAPAADPGPTGTDQPDPATPAPADAPADTVESVPPQAVPANLVPGARFAVVNHRQATGRPITVEELAARLSLTPAMAGRLLTALGEPTGPATVNGARLAGGQS